MHYFFFILLFSLNINHLYAVLEYSGPLLGITCTKSCNTNGLDNGIDENPLFGSASPEFGPHHFDYTGELRDRKKRGNNDCNPTSLLPTNKKGKLDEEKETTLENSKRPWPKIKNGKLVGLYYCTLCSQSSDVWKNLQIHAHNKHKSQTHRPKKCTFCNLTWSHPVTAHDERGCPPIDPETKRRQARDNKKRREKRNSLSSQTVSK